MRDRKLIIAVSFLAAISVSIGCEGQLPPHAIQLLQNSYAGYEIGDQTGAMKNLNAFLREFPTSSRSDEAYYLRGLIKYRLADAQGAKIDLSATLDQTSNKQLRSKAMVMLGDLGWDANEMSVAEDMYIQAISDIRWGEKPADHVHYRLGCILQRQGRWEDADLHFDRVIYSFENSKLGKLSARRTHCTAWTIQIAAFSERPPSDLLVSRLGDQNLSAARKTLLLDGRIIFVVQIGRFSTWSEAVRVLGEIQVQHSDAFAVPTR